MAEYEQIAPTTGMQVPPPKNVQFTPMMSTLGAPSTDLKTQVNFLQSTATQYLTNAAAITDYGERKMKVKRTTAIGNMCKLFSIILLICSVTSIGIITFLLINRGGKDKDAEPVHVHASEPQITF